MFDESAMFLFDVFSKVISDLRLLTYPV